MESKETLKEIAFERMKEEDLDEVLAIERTSFPTPWTKNMFYREICDISFSHFLVARFCSKVVGYGGFWLVVDEAHISNLAVHPEFRRQGIGRGLLTSILELARAKGAAKATLEVRNSNFAAQQLYGQFGFRILAIRKKYYQDSGEDAVIMWIDLSE